VLNLTISGKMSSSFLNLFFYLAPPNQSLKLTEPAVDDLAARGWTDLGASDRNVRATNYRAAALRRRSLAPVR